jgi:hypothetical protein
MLPVVLFNHIYWLSGIDLLPIILREEKKQTTLTDEVHKMGQMAHWLKLLEFWNPEFFRKKYN